MFWCCPIQRGAVNIASGRRKRPSNYTAAAGLTGKQSASITLGEDSCGDSRNTCIVLRLECVHCVTLRYVALRALRVAVKKFAQLAHGVMFWLLLFFSFALAFSFSFDCVRLMGGYLIISGNSLIFSHSLNHRHY